jgi:tRNA(Met) cytidine acetyltransferase
MDQAQLRPIQDLTARLRRTLAAARHRGCLVLAGPRDWGSELAETLLLRPGREVLWIGEAGPAGARRLPAARARAALGGEVDDLVFDAHSGFDPDAFGAVSGALRAGGLLLLLCPPLDRWPDFADPDYRRMVPETWEGEPLKGRFLRRLVRVLKTGTACLLVEPDRPLPTAPVHAGEQSPATAGSTPDQEQAVAALVQVARGHRHRPLVLVSDRGRGKSAALGMAGARLLPEGWKRILVTAPRVEAVEPLFRHAGSLLAGAASVRGHLRWHGREIRFLPPDELLRSDWPAELLLVDEAAGIPAPLLEALLRKYSRIAFATTAHGYEGTGRGFALRFEQTLDRQTPGWRRLELNQPIRWAPDDPLESLVFQALLLDAAPAEEGEVRGATPDTCTWESLDRDRLAGDEPLLRQVFGLLVCAHYRTRPFDLRQLLDGPDLSVQVLRLGEAVVATALVLEEGGLDPELCHGLYTGRRRPRGHLIPQSLAAHVGLEHAPALRGARIMRIAVHPAVQNRGLGGRLVTAIRATAEARGLDWLGACFGATAALVPFWFRQGLVPVRIGMHRDGASGSHSLMVLQPLSPAGEALVRRARGRYLAHLPDWLSDPLADLEPELVSALGRRLAADPEPMSAPGLSEADWAEILALAFARRGYEDSLAPVRRLVTAALEQGRLDRLPAQQRDLLLGRVLERRSWPTLVRALGLSGRAEALAAMRAALRSLVGELAPSEILRVAEALGAEGEVGDP